MGEAPPSIRLLGEPMAVVEGCRVALGQRQATLLAVLAANSPRAAGHAAIVDGVWWDDPPASARNAVQVLVSRLRRLLGNGAIETVGDGYRLGSVDVDVSAFTVDVAAATSLTRAGDDVGAVEVLVRALARWDGPPLSGVPATPFVDGERLRLEALHLAARLQHVRARSAVDPTAELIGDLTALHAEHPVHEGVAALLMRALYDQGRQVEALDLYDRVREHLLEELGLDPSPVLVDTHRAVLAQNVGPPPAVHQRAAPPSAGVRGVPAVADQTVGREADVAAVQQLLQTSPGRMVTVMGSGGVGKTRLATLVGQQVQMSGGEVAFASLVDVTDVDGAAGTIAGALGIGAVTGVVGAVVEGLQRRRVLLVCDNAEHVPGLADLLAELRERASGLSLLTTSRIALGLPGEQRYHLEPLPHADVAGPAVQLLLTRARHLDPSLLLTKADHPLLLEIAQLCDGLPLAIELAAAKTRTLSLRELADGLRRSSELLADDRPVRAPWQGTVEASISWSLGLLAPVTAGVAEDLAVLRGGFDAAGAAAVTGLDLPAVLDHLQVLVDHSLLRRRSINGRSRFEQLGIISRHLLATSAGPTAPDVQDRLAAHFAGLVSPGDRPVRLRRRAEDWRALVLERDNVRQAVAWALTADDPAVAADLVIGAALIWFDLGPHDELSGWLDHLQARADLSTARRADALLWRARLLDAVNDYAGSLSSFASAEALADSLRDPTRRALAQLLAAFPALKSGDPAAARGHVDRALGSGVGQDPEVHAIALSTDALLLGVEGRRTEALAAEEQAVALARRTGMDLFLPIALSHLCELEAGEDPDHALLLAEEGLRMADLLGDDWHRTILMGYRGAVLLRLGDDGGASQALEHAVRLALRLGMESWAHEAAVHLAGALSTAAPEAAAMLVGVIGATQGPVPSGLAQQTWTTVLEPLAARLGGAHRVLVDRGRGLGRSHGLLGALEVVFDVRASCGRPTSPPA